MKRKNVKKLGQESSKESSLRDWFKRKGAKGKKGGWVDCNAPDGKGGYKSCGRSSGEKRKKYPACRPTPGACKERGRGKSWGKKGSKKKRNENMQLTTEQIKKIIQEELAGVLGESSSDIASLENLWNAKEYNQVEQLVRSLADPEVRKWYMGKKYEELDDRYKALAEDPYYNQGTEIYEQYDMEMEDLQALEQELKALEGNTLMEKEGKKDACYHKVRSRYDVWPSAYASGALVKCRKVGAKNWGNKSKKNESLNEEYINEEEMSDEDRKSLEKIRDKLYGASKAHKGQADDLDKILKEEELEEAEYRGRKVKLNKPMRGDVKKFKVYVKDPKTGNIKKVNFGHGGTSAKKKGEKTMKIKKSNPKRRKSFRARHNCDNPGPKTKARYWSCRKW